ncbi:MAG: spore coat protein [Ruminococcus sp.]|nr:spore coat protein [Ruminococcus sp.]
MDDRNLMENMLMLEKGACDLFMHGTIEASTDNVHRTFSDSLNTSLNLQEQIYSKMQEKGWYPNEQAEQSKLNSVKMKFRSQC